MGEQVRILVVEDDPTMQRLLASHLGARGYKVVAATDGWQALKAAREEPIDVVLLDITLPHGLDGVEVCRQLRARSPVAIILVTAAQRPETKITVLDMGADDYLVKPFDANELLARIRAVLRRSYQGGGTSKETIRAGGLVIDTAAREARCGGVLLRLTRLEFDLLAFLARQPDRTITYERILEVLWGPGYQDTRLIHTHMSHLRHKLDGCQDGSGLIVAVPGVGYRLRLAE